jgi:hypothetical protein
MGDEQKRMIFSDNAQIVFPRLANRLKAVGLAGWHN